MELKLLQKIKQIVGGPRGNEQTSFNESKSSGLCFLSYPGGGNGKQRDIAHFPRQNEMTTIKKTTFLGYFSWIAEFQNGNRPAIKSLSMHHAPTLTSSFSTPPSSSACTDPYTLITLLLGQALHPSPQNQTDRLQLQLNKFFNMNTKIFVKHKTIQTQLQ